MISVVVATYNPVWRNLEKTLKSILYQKDIEFEIIITDDASISFPKDKIDDLFKSFNFDRYKIRRSSANRGIVDNVYRGCELANGEYIKLISPGDFLINNHTLHEWNRYMMDNHLQISFGDAVHYKMDGTMIKVLCKKSMPRVKRIYKSNKNDDAKKINYVLLEDAANGTTFLCERELLMKYLFKIHNRVIYAEDLSYRLMVLDGVDLRYYNQNVVLYESSEGVSWSSAFRQSIENDVNTVKNIILETDYKNNDFALKYQRYLRSINKCKHKIIKKTLRRLFFPDVLYWEIYRKVNKIYTSIEIDMSYVKDL